MLASMRRAALLGALLLMLAMTSSGSAQPEPPAEPCPVPINTSDAGQWYWLGKEQSKADNRRCAMEAYAKSWELLPSYDNAGNGGMHAALLEEHALACTLLSYSLAHIPESMDEQQKEAVRQKMTQTLRESLRHVGRARVETRAGAKILVDGQPIGTAPLDPPELCLWPGSRIIEARLEGFQTERVTVEVKVGPPQAVALPLQPMVAKAAGPKPKPDEEEPSGGPSMALGIAGLVVGGAGAFTGIALLLASAGRADTVDEIGAKLDADPSLPQPNPCGEGPVVVPQCEEIARASDDKATFLNTGITALVLGGAILIGSTVYLLLTQGDDGDEKAVRLAPLVAHQLAGAVLSGRF